MELHLRNKSQTKVFSRNSQFQPTSIPMASQSALHTERNHQFLPYLTPQMTTWQSLKFMESPDEERRRSMPHVLGIWKLKRTTQTDKVSTKPNKTRSQILPFREASRTCQIALFILNFKMQLLRLD